MAAISFSTSKTASLNASAAGEIVVLRSDAVPSGPVSLDDRVPMVDCVRSGEPVLLPELADDPAQTAPLLPRIDLP